MKKSSDRIFPQQETNKFSFDNVRTGLIAAALILPISDQSKAETAPEQGTISYKYLDYLDSQPGDDRIRVKANAFRVLSPISSEWSLNSSLITDGISGASPSYHNSNLKKMQDRRNAATTEVTRYLPDGTVSVGLNYSKEQDYLSKGLVLKGTHQRDDKNLIWNYGLSISMDKINPSNLIVHNEEKKVVDLIGGVTRILTENDIVQFNIGQSIGSGYFTDPYKLIDNRPRNRNHTTFTTRWNHYINDWDATLKFSYRFYHDNWDIRSHTFDVEYSKAVAGGWIISPMLRLYFQNSANFYIDADSSTYPFPPQPSAGARYYSEDQRLSAFGAEAVGLKITKILDKNWFVDLKIEEYTQKGSWYVFGKGSPGLAEFRARTMQFGISRRF